MACALADVESAGPGGALSARDIGVRLAPAGCAMTFAGGTGGSVRILFDRPVPGAGPLAGCPRPTLVVTAVDPELLVERLQPGVGRG